MENKKRLTDVNPIIRNLTAMKSMYDAISLDGMIKALEDAPAVDAVEVVRCKECKHKGWIQEPCHGKSVDFCNVFDSTINNPEKCYWYYGERRQHEDD